MIRNDEHYSIEELCVFLQRIGSICRSTWRIIPRQGKHLADWDDPKVNENPPINLLPEIGGPIFSLPIFCWFVDLGLEPIGGLLLEIGLPTFHNWRFIVGLVCGYGSTRGAPFFFPIAGEVDGG